jgi:predicted nucleotidyltransferase
MGLDPNFPLSEISVAQVIVVGAEPFTSAVKEIPHQDRGLSRMPTESYVLVRFRAALRELYGEQLERVILYGSRARGEARPDSDYDVAVFLRDLADRWAEADRIAIVATEILNETGAVIHAMPYRASDYGERTPLMHEIRQEGLDL